MRAIGCAFAVCLSVLTIAAVGGAGPAAGQAGGEVEALHERAAELYRARKYGEAMPIAQQALALGEQRFGPDDARLGKLFYGVALLHDVQGRYAEAEPFYQRTLAVLEKARGADHVSVGKILNDLAGLYARLKRHTDAEPLYQRSLAILEKALGSDHADVADHSTGSLSFIGCKGVSATPSRSTSACSPSGKERRVPRTRMWPPR